MGEQMSEMDKVLFGVRRSVRYHNRRTRFFDQFSKATKFIAALSGTAAFASFMSAAPTWLSFCLLGVVTVSSTLDLIVGSARSARLHSDLARRFFTLEKEIIGIADPTPDHVTAITAKRLDIEAEEPPPLKVLDCICHNELLRAMGYDPSEFVEISFLQRLTANFFDHREHTIIKKRGACTP